MRHRKAPKHFGRCTADVLFAYRNSHSNVLDLTARLSNHLPSTCSGLKDAILGLESRAI